MSDPTTDQVSSITTDISEVASVAAEIAPLAGPYGLIASQVLQGIAFLAKEAPDAYAVIAKAFQSADPTATDFDALTAELQGLNLDS